MFSIQETVQRDITLEVLALIFFDHTMGDTDFNQRILFVS